MPIILPPIPDPSLPLIAGEQGRESVEVRPASRVDPVMGGGVTTFDPMSLIVDEDRYPPMNSMVGEVSSLFSALQMRNNAGVATPTGAWVWMDYVPLMSSLLWATERWIIAGVTRDSAGSPLGNCRVIVLDLGQTAVGSAQAVAAETVSDGSGNYSVEVAHNKAYQVVCYLPGAPNVAGASDYVTPTQA